MQRFYHRLFQFLCSIALGGDRGPGAPPGSRRAGGEPRTGKSLFRRLPSRGRP